MTVVVKLPTTTVILKLLASNVLSFANPLFIGNQSTCVTSCIVYNVHCYLYNVLM